MSVRQYVINAVQCLCIYIDKTFNYRMSNFIMYIKILRTKKIIFDKKNYFWLDKKKLNNFTVSILTRKLLQFASKYEQ